MTTTQALLACGILSVGMVLQGAVGFGVALFAVPLLLAAGIPLPIVVALFPFSSLAQCSWNCYQIREDVPWRDSIRITGWRLVGLPLGGYLLLVLSGAESLCKQVIGVLLLLILAGQHFACVKPRESIPDFWAALAGSTSGFLAGAFGMGGPPLVLWATAHEWPARRTRGLLYSAFLLFTPPWVAAMLIMQGTVIIKPMLISILFAPAIIAGAHLGSKLGDRLDREQLSRIVTILLVIIGISVIVEPWLRGS
ncbi:MAG TPA: hypothetical protein DCR55_12635 [Lentisphaeria bacterium]|nr:hypothetical protein [Lentisphaeria bacterium]